MIPFDARGAARGLAAAEVVDPVAPVVPRSLDDHDWNRLVTMVRAERLEPQLAAAVAAGTVIATRAQRDQANALHASAMATSLLLDRQLLDVATLFERASIDYVVLKGAAAAYLDRPDPARRAYGDVDVLVAAPHIESAERLLSTGGGARAYREPRPGFDRRFGKGSSFRMPSGFEVDVHRTLALGPFGLAIEPRQLFAGGETFALGGRALRALDRPRRFVHSCCHAVLGRAEPRFVPLLDVTYTAPADEAERAAVGALATAWRTGLVVERAVALAKDELGWTPPPATRWGPTELGVTTQQRRWLEAYVGAGRSSARLTMSAVEAIEGWGDRFGYLAAVVWPSNLTPVQAVRRIARGGRSVVRSRRG